VLFVGLSHYAVAYTDHWRLFVGLAFIALVLFAPDGLVRILRDRLRLPMQEMLKIGKRKSVASPEEHRA